MTTAIELKILAHDDLTDFNALISVFERVFEMRDFKRPPAAHLQKLLHRENFIAMVAKAGDQVMGGLTVYILDQYYSEKPLGYIYDLAVLQEHQRKGVGSRLIAFTKQVGRERNFEEVFVQADRVDGYALDFYRSTKPTAEEDVLHFYYRLL